MKDLLLVGILFAIAGCRPHRSEAEIVDIARRTAQANQKRIEDYQTPKVSLHAGEWWVFFAHKPPGYAGGHFFVRVNDETKEARYLPGE